MFQRRIVFERYCITISDDGLIDLCIDVKWFVSWVLVFLIIADIGPMFLDNEPLIISTIIPLALLYKENEDPALVLIIVLILTFVQGFQV